MEEAPPPVRPEELMVTTAFLRAKARSGAVAELMELTEAICAAEAAGCDVGSDALRQALEYVEANGGGVESVKQQELLSAWQQTGGSWYDAGVRLMPKGVAPPPPPPVEVNLEPIKNQGLTASAQASLFAGLLSAVAVLGIDVTSFGVAENFDVAILVGGLALSQMESDGPVGAVLRATGNVTSAVATEVVAPTATIFTRFWRRNEVGYTSRAVLELGLEQAVYAVNPKRRTAERLSQEYEAAATVAATLRAEKDALPFFALQDRFAKTDELMAAERKALEAKRAAQAAFDALA